MPSLDDILARHELERKDLQFKCPRKIKDLVAEATGDMWNRVGRALHVSESKLKAIHHDISVSGPEDKAVSTIDAWSKEYAEHATCLKLVQALYRLKKRTIIHSICKEVQRTKAFPTASNHHYRPENKQRKVLDKKAADRPMFNNKDWKRIIDTKSPIPTPANLRDYLKKYKSEVVVLIHTVKEEEVVAAWNHLSSPVQDSVINKPIRWYDENISLTLGTFGEHKAALIQTSKGVDCQHELMPALRYLPNVKLIIGLGFAYARKSKCNLGDVIVSTYVDGVGNCRIEEGRLKFDEGRVRYTGVSTVTANVFTKGISSWTSFKCSTADREAKAHAGVLISSPMLLNDQHALGEYLRNNERFIGGEMEGQELAHAQLQLRENENRQVDFVVIKGVADFGDGTKGKAWQLTASLAATNFAVHKLCETAGTVYYSGVDGTLHCIARAEESSRVSYLLKIINGRVKKCHGCRQNFRREGVPLTPPDDLVVSRLEQRSFRLKSGTLSKAPGNVYYHLDIGCIKLINPAFEWSTLAISDSEKAKLNDAHKDKLQKLGLKVD